MNEETVGDDIKTIREQELHQDAELSRLFGEDTVAQARLIDIVDLNLNDAMTTSIASGIRDLKRRRGNHAAQLELVNAMEPGERLLLCLWVRDMGILENVR